MVYDDDLAQRVREQMIGLPKFEEKHMFGGIGFMLHGHMASGVIGDELIVRVGPEKYQVALGQPHTHPFDMTGRPMRGWVVVTRDGYAADEDLRTWVERGVQYTLSLPAK